jgi:hypothetical protein
MTRTCYSAIFSAYDEVKQPFIITPGWKYVMYTDQDFELPANNVWDIRKVPVMDCGPQKTARYYKIMFHEAVEDSESLWVDGTFFINIDLNQWWERFTYPFTTVRHPFDNCVYREIEACQRGKKASFSQLKGQRDCYKRLGVPKHGGLIASGVLMRRKTPLVIDFCKMWWKQVNQWSGRDQIAFAYVDYKMPRTHISIDWNYTTQDEFIHIPHLTKKWRSARFDEVMKKYGSDQK